MSIQNLTHLKWDQPDQLLHRYTYGSSKPTVFLCNQVSLCPVFEQVAVARGTPIMSEKWITECWEHREDTNASALEPPLSHYKQLPFTGCVIALHGFPIEEEEEMKQIALNNGETSELSFRTVVT